MIDAALFRKYTVTILPVLALIAGGLLSAYAMYTLFGLLSYEMHPAHHGLAGHVYTAIGRGILNGLVPYRDLFEYKPPGIFLISASSLWISGDIGVGNILQGAVEAGTLLLLLLPATRAGTDTRKLLLLCCGLVFGTLLVHYMAERGGHFQTESFGAFFSVAYAALILRLPKKTSWHVVAAGLLIAAAVGLKETYLAVLLAAALLARPVRELPKTLLMPVAVAGVAGILVLAMLGYLAPYLSFYVPEMLQGRASFNPFPVWVLGFFGHMVLLDIGRFSPWLLASLVLLGWLSLARAAGALHDGRMMRVLAALLTIFVAVYGTIAALLVRAVSLITSYDQFPKPTDAYFLPVTLAIIAFSGIAWTLSHRSLGRAKARTLLAAFMRHLAAAVLVTLSILLGGMESHQLGHAVPIVALLYLMAADAITPSDTRSFPVFVAAMLCAAIGIATLAVPPYDTLLQARIRDDAAARTAAARIDGLMSACGYDRYLIFGEPAVPYAYTEHSPYGPVFMRTGYIFPVAWRKPPIAHIQDGFRENLHRARFVIARTVQVQGKTMIDASDIPDDVWNEYARTFTAEAPPCARQFPPTGDVAFRFRREEL